MKEVDYRLNEAKASAGGVVYVRFGRPEVEAKLMTAAQLQGLLDAAREVCEGTGPDHDRLVAALADIP